MDDAGPEVEDGMRGDSDEEEVKLSVRAVKPPQTCPMCRCTEEEDFTQNPHLSMYPLRGEHTAVMQY
ncbi:hypothetical protein CesoFtcFv8_000638 [Champsocephalus esox]|uniref:Uncharacterized protein n=1 Tax=Champsocephalus esox TaxID=159716 RepID=A0AAN8D6S0_9TELE|nr:hypothetical protein CesoFtcFv8_000638 [Champsocephalus esox]